MLTQRIISALVGIPLVVIAVWFGGIPLVLLTGLIIVLGLREMNEMLAKLGLKPSLWLAVAGGLIMTAGSYLYKAGYPGPTITIILFMHLLATVALYPRYSLLDSAGTMMGTLYVGLLNYFYLLRMMPDGWIWLIFTLTATWATDTAAYFVGMVFGRRRIAPALSPKKTVEGAVGGFIGSILVAGVFSYIYTFLPMSKVLLLGLSLGAAAQVGDLLESAFKRQAGVKDSSALIPGHGGILDRIDSTLFTAPLVYYFVLLFIKS
ncbi:phosphatidate cytidylyltransferase [Pelotomaculum propionicicum]|uniref:phosphatidate cytidylyltransferase n=1 Tax=Pelotomaculum propionicicum TaxID=258475 RepID=UPI003B7A13A6